MKITLYFLVFFIFSSPAANAILAQSNFSAFTGGTMIALGGSSVALQGVSALMGNTAGLAEQAHFTGALSVENRFQTEGLTRVAMAGSTKLGRGILGVTWMRTGFSLYVEQKMGVFYTRTLTNRVAASLHFIYLMQGAEGEDSWSAISGEVGCRAKLNNKVSLGMHVFHPAGFLFAESSGVESRVRVGCQYSPAEGVLLMADLDKPSWRPWSLRTGLAYSPHRHCEIYLGVNPVLGVFSFGVALSKKRGLFIASGVGMHQNLGTSSAVTVGYE